MIGRTWITRYRIKRDHDNRTGFFVVNVPEAGHRGIGFQIRIGAYVYGLSFVICSNKSRTFPNV